MISDSGPLGGDDVRGAVGDRHKKELPRSSDGSPRKPTRSCDNEEWKGVQKMIHRRARSEISDEDTGVSGGSRWYSGGGCELVLEKLSGSLSMDNFWKLKLTCSGQWGKIPEDIWVEIHDVSIDVMAMGPNNSACAGMSLSQVCHQYILPLSILKLNFFPCAEVLRGGPAHLYPSPISHKNTYILTFSHSNPFHSTPKLPSTHTCKPSYSLMNQILIDATPKFPDQIRPIVYPTHFSYDSQFLHLLQSSPPNQPLFTTDVTRPIFTNSLQTFGQNQPLNHGCTFTRPDHVHVTTHLEDKVEVWAAGSGKYSGGSLDSVYIPQLVLGGRPLSTVACLISIENSKPACINAWMGYWKMRTGLFQPSVAIYTADFGTMVARYTKTKELGVIQLAFQGLSAPIISKNENKHKDVPLMHYSRAISLTRDFEVTWVGEVRLIFDPGLTPNFVNTIIPAQGSSCCTLKAVARLRLMLKIYSTIRLSIKHLQNKVVCGKKGISNLQLTSSFEAPRKFHPSEGEDINRHLASSLKLMMQPTFKSSNIADYWFPVLFIPPLSEVGPDYYPP